VLWLWNSSESGILLCRKSPLGPTVSKFQLVLLIHAHQPVGNFEDVFERAYAQSYLPFVEVLERHPAIRVGLHYTGSLLEWFEQTHPEYFERLRALVARGQVEIVGGGFYEPILVAIPPEDRREQITRLAEYIEKHFGARPRGAWLAERVWEPQLPSSLAPSGVEYTLVDDNHYLGAGFDLDQLFGYYLAEDQGATVKVIPGLKAFRYLIPYRPPEETIEFLRRAAGVKSGGFAAMGDDLEKFGVWPGTHDHCYRDGWLQRFFTELAKNSDWLELSTPGDAAALHAPLGRADLPTASYTEMMEWSLPTSARDRYHVLTNEFSSRPQDLPFLRGGIWRNFFTKYGESNLLHKKMLHVSEKVRRLAGRRRSDKAFPKAREKATMLVLKSQCNDAYWHGVFGGLYSPHLRTMPWRALVEAEAIADGLTHRGRSYADGETLDFDADGSEEVYFTSERYAALLKPSDGGTICALDFRPANATLINSLMRRPEAYHAALKNLPGKKPQQAAQSIHEQARVKEDGLERWLQYDRWPRHNFRLLLFDAAKSYSDCAMARLDEDVAVAAGRYSVVNFSATRASLASGEGTDWSVAKDFAFHNTPEGFDLVCNVKLRRAAPQAGSIIAAIETTLNFLAPAAPDRYFEAAGERYPLRWSASVPASELRVVDEWQKVSVTLSAPNARDYWVAPIETVSESEEGFERIYQGSQILAIWPLEMKPGAEWNGQLTLRIASIR
jgi:hypothetical protein